MKFKALTLLAASVALTLTATPFALQAQTISSSPLIIAQGGGKGAWEGLELTDTQKSQIRTIRNNTRTQIEGILTTEQKEKLKAAFEARRTQRQEGQRPQGQRQRGQGLWKDLNLTQEQKTQMRQIHESEKQQIQALLTPEQKQKLQQLRENARSRRQQPSN